LVHPGHKILTLEEAVQIKHKEILQSWVTEGSSSLKELERLMKECLVHSQKQDQHFSIIETNLVLVFQQLKKKLEEKEAELRLGIQQKKKVETEKLKKFEERVKTEYENLKAEYDAVQKPPQKEYFQQWISTPKNLSLSLDR
jgi:hypothetical protein